MEAERPDEGQAGEERPSQLPTGAFPAPPRDAGPSEGAPAPAGGEAAAGPPIGDSQAVTGAWPPPAPPSVPGWAAETRIEPPPPGSGAPTDAPPGEAQPDLGSAATLPPQERAAAAGAGRWLLGAAAVLLVGVALGVVGRALLTAGARPAPVRVEVLEPDPGSWVEGEVVVRGRVHGLSEGRVALAGGEVAALVDRAFALASGPLPDGVHDLSLEVRGRLPSGAPVTVVQPVRLQVDGTPPELTIEAPDPGDEVAAPLRLRARVVDASPVQLTARLDGQTVRTVGLPPGAPPLEHAIPGVPPGPHQLTVEVMDAAGHVVSRTRSFVMAAADAPPPPPPPSGPPPPRVVLGWAPDAVVGAGPLDVRIADAEGVSVLLDGEPVAGELPWGPRPGAVTDGRHLLEVVARSPAGEAREARPFVFDGTAPELEVRAASDAPAPLRLEGRVADAHDPSPRLVLIIDGAPPREVELPLELDLAPGAHTLVLRARDAVGNAREERLELTVRPAEDGVAPPPPQVDPAPDPAGPPAIEVVQPGPEGWVREVAVEARLRAAAGVAAGAASLGGQGLQATLEAVEPGLAVLRARAEAPADGLHELRIELRDRAGRTEVLTQPVRVDRTPPALTLVDPEVQTFRGAAVLRVRARDAGAGLTGVRVAVGTAQGDVTADLAPAGPDGLHAVELELPPGAYLGEVTATDGAGNVSSIPRMFRLEAEEPDAPQLVRVPTRTRGVLTIEPVEGQIEPGSTIIVTVAGIRMLRTKELPAAVPLDPGRYRVYVLVVSPRGERRVQEELVTVDVTPPTFRRLRFLPTGPTSARAEGDVVDPDGAVALRVFLNDELVGEGLPCDLELAPGVNVLRVEATDDVGNSVHRTRVLRVVETADGETTRPGPESGDPREGEAQDLLLQGRHGEALRVLNEALRDQRQARSLLVLRARVHAAIAGTFERALDRQQRLNRALTDCEAAIANYGPRHVRSEHYRLKVELLEALGRPTQAAEATREAERLESMGR